MADDIDWIKLYINQELESDEDKINFIEDGDAGCHRQRASLQEIKL